MNEPILQYYIREGLTERWIEHAEFVRLSEPQVLKTRHAFWCRCKECNGRVGIVIK